MENARQFHVNLYQQRVTSVVRLEIVRGDETLAKNVVVLERSNSFERFATLVNDRQHLVPRLSILALPIDRSTVGLLPEAPRRPYGVLVARLAVTTNGPRGDLLPGDVIYEVNHQPVSNLKDLRALIDKQDADGFLALQIERGGKLRYVEIHPE
jgi:S1-C subfamily serine protease